MAKNDPEDKSSAKKPNARRWLVDKNYDQSSIGQLTLDVDGVAEEVLAGCVVAPQILSKNDGTIEIIGWSLIRAAFYNKPTVETEETINARNTSR